MKRIRLLSLLFVLFVCLSWALPLQSVHASADMGPKPSVRITFENMSGELCYGTLLSKTPSTGPFSAFQKSEDGEHDNRRYYDDLPAEIWEKFVAYADSDGYYFLQFGKQVNLSKQLNWTYYPPKNFKILLYYPEQDLFAVSQSSYERYAFDSYYTVDLLDERTLNAERSYDYFGEILGLLARILLTVAIEMGLAWLFGFRNKSALLFLLAVNGGTQVILNVLLNIVNYRSGALVFLLYYFLWEFIVFAVEALAFCLFMNKVSEKKHGIFFYILFALLANAISFLFGAFISQWLPSIF